MINRSPHNNPSFTIDQEKTQATRANRITQEIRATRKTQATRVMKRSAQKRQTTAKLATTKRQIEGITWKIGRKIDQKCTGPGLAEGLSEPKDG